MELMLRCFHLRNYIKNKNHRKKLQKGKKFVLLQLIKQEIMEDRKTAIKSSCKQNRSRKGVKFHEIFNSSTVNKKEEKDQLSRNLSKNKIQSIFQICYNSLADSRLQRQKNIQFLFEVYKGVLYSKNLKKQLSNNFLVSNIVELPNKSDRKKTLLLGLDQTLIYTSSLKKKFGQKSKELHVSTQQEFEQEIQVIVRPYLQQFLYTLNEFYNIYLFSSSTENYIRKILKGIDPCKIIKGYLSKKNCFTTKKGYIVKDLRIIGNCELKDIAIIDKSVYSFAMQLENGIPIHPFYGDQQDIQLKKLGVFLRQGARCSDLRIYIEKNLKLSQLNLIPEPYMGLLLKSQT